MEGIAYVLELQIAQTIDNFIILENFSIIRIHQIFVIYLYVVQFFVVTCIKFSSGIIISEKNTPPKNVKLDKFAET